MASSVEDLGISQIGSSSVFSTKSRKLLPFEIKEAEETPSDLSEEERVEKELEKMESVTDEDVEGLITEGVENCAEALYSRPEPPPFDKNDVFELTRNLNLAADEENDEVRRKNRKIGRYFKFWGGIEKALKDEDYRLACHVVRNYRIVSTVTEFLEVIVDSIIKDESLFTFFFMENGLDDDLYELALEFTTRAKTSLELLISQIIEGFRSYSGFFASTRYSSGRIKKRLLSLSSKSRPINNHYAAILRGLQEIDLLSKEWLLWNIEDLDEIASQSDYESYSFAKVPERNQRQTAGILKELIITLRTFAFDKTVRNILKEVHQKEDELEDNKYFDRVLGKLFEAETF
ncbi:MAG: hypothetical protein ACE5OZ_15035 [Candidatus Heimdallarchaeota archaeon]